MKRPGESEEIGLAGSFSAFLTAAADHMSRRLDEISADVLLQVFYWLDPTHIGGLYLTGSRNLCLQITHKLRSLSGWINSDFKAYHMLPRLKNLEECLVSWHQTPSKAIDRFNSVISKSKLRTWNFRSEEALNNWYLSQRKPEDDANAPQGLQRQLPHLEELSIHGISTTTLQPIEPSLFQDLPSSLTKLHISYSRIPLEVIIKHVAPRLVHCEFEPNYPHSEELIGDLFGALSRECVYLKYNHISRILSLSAATYERLPRSLTRFECYASLGTQELLALPSCLIELSIFEATFEDFETAQIAAHMAAVRTLCISNCNTLFASSGRSPFMFLHSLMTRNSLDCAHFAALPPSLKKLRLSTDFSRRNTEGGQLGHLPRGLTTLEMRCKVEPRLSDIELLPPYLTKLDMMLTISWTDETIKALPRTLQFLYLSSGSLTHRCVEYLPPAIQYVKLSATFTSDLFKIRAFPPWLSYLRVWQIQMLPDCTTDATKLIKSLPFSLEVSQIVPVKTQLPS